MPDLELLGVGRFDILSCHARWSCRTRRLGQRRLERRQLVAVAAERRHRRRHRVVVEVVLPVDLVDRGRVALDLGLRDAVDDRALDRRSRSMPAPSSWWSCCSSPPISSRSRLRSFSSSSSSSRIGFSSISSCTRSTSSIRESCRSLIACCSWGVITSCCDSFSSCRISMAIGDSPLDFQLVSISRLRLRLITGTTLEDKRTSETSRLVKG